MLKPVTGHRASIKMAAAICRSNQKEKKWNTGNWAKAI
jgi:hypothetical protein